MVRISSWCCGIWPTATLSLPARGWSWSMYSKRRSKRAPGSVHAPCTFQLVFTMQNAEPHEACAALPAHPNATAPRKYATERFIAFSLIQRLQTRVLAATRLTNGLRCGLRQRNYATIRRSTEERVEERGTAEEAAAARLAGPAPAPARAGGRGQPSRRH